MNMAGFYEESISNGEGWRAVLFVSGCPHNCKGCHNKEAQDFNYGEAFKKDEIIKKIKGNSILSGITISGGEPLCDENVDTVLDFVKTVKDDFKNFNIWCYSGYTFEELIKRQNKNLNTLLTYIDVLVDGRFIEEKKVPNLKFRGSTNQRFVDVKKSLENKKVVLRDDLYN